MADAISAKTAWALAKAIKGGPKRKGPTNGTATVVRVDQDGTHWVRISGSDVETPVNGAITVDAKAGDTVQYHLEDTRISITGNASSPSVGRDYVGGEVSVVTKQVEAVRASIVETNELVAAKATIGQLEAERARIGELEADHVSVSDFQAEQANIDSLQVATADIDTIRANSAKVQNLTAAQLEADHAKVGQLDVSQIAADHATIGNLDTTYMHANMANADVAWIQNGTIKDGAIVSAMINDVSANKLTAGTINASEITVTNLNADNITTGTINGQRIGEGSLSLDKLSEDVYTETEVNTIVDGLNDRIDGAIETFTGTAVPTLNNQPASSWNTTKLKDEHVGDVYYVVNSQSQQNGYCYRFTKSGSTYSWQLIKDSDVTAALSRLTTAEGKITTFDSDISTLKTDTGTLTTKTESLETRMSDAEADILDKVDTTTFNEVSDTVDQHSRTISQMSEAISNKADGSTVTAVTNRVSKNEQDISGINTTIGELQDTVETKADGSTVETVSNRLNTVSNTVDGHTQTLTSVQNTLSSKADSSTVSTLTTQVNNVSDTVDGHTSQLSSITTTQTTIQSTLDKTVKSSIQLWYSKANTTAPSKPTSQVTSTSTSGNAWRTVVPAYNSSYPHYFYCWQYEYVDGTYGWSAVVRDIAMGESQSTARAADSNASAAVTTANTASTNASTALSTAITANTNASDAKTAAATASTTASEAKTTAETAASDASTAKTNAASAVSTANSASTTATNAQSTANANIKSSVQLWFTKANSTAPNKPTSVVSTSNANTANAWNLVVPVWNSSYPHYFYCYQQQKGDGNYQWTDVVYDRATSEAQQLANTTSTSLSTLQEDYATYKQTTTENVSSIGSRLTTAEGKISTAETNISQNAQNIELKVSKDGVISSINQSAETVKIQASKVEIDGAAVFNNSAFQEQLTSSYSKTIEYAYNNAGQGTGYAKLANITAKAAYLNLPITFTLYRRGIASATHATIAFANGSPTDTIRAAYYDGWLSLYYVRVGTGSYDIYIALGDSWDTVKVADFVNPYTSSNMEVTWAGEYYGTSLPSGAVAFTRLIGAETKESYDNKIANAEANAKAYADATKIGGRNLIPWSALSGTYVSAYDKASNGYAIVIPTSTSVVTKASRDIFDRISSGLLSIGSQATLSFTAVATGNTNLCCDFYPDTYTGAFSNVVSPVTTTPKRYTITGKIENSSSPTSLQVRFWRLASDANYAITIWDIKLESGTHATDWSPAPEDLVTRTQRIYYRWNSATAPAAPTSWVAKGDDGSALWTKMHVAITSTHKYIYTCEQYEMADGTLGHTDVLLDNTITVIDGGNIITGSVAANKLNASDINASKTLTVGAMTDAAAATILNSNVQVGGRNLLRRSYYQQTTTTGGITCTNNGDGSVTINGTTTATPTVYYFNDSSASSRGHVTLEGGTYTLSGCPDGGSDGTWRLDMYGIPTSSGTVAAVDYGDGVTFTTTGGTPSYIRMRFPSGITLNNFTVWPKLERGNKPTDWTPAPEDVDSAISDAAKTATSYVTDITGGGIMVHPSDDDTSGVRITDDVDIMRGGTSAINIGTNGAVRIGVDDSAHVKMTLESDAMSIENESNDEIFSVDSGSTGTSTVALTAILVTWSTTASVDTSAHSVSDTGTAAGTPTVTATINGTEYALSSTYATATVTAGTGVSVALTSAGVTYVQGLMVETTEGEEGTVTTTYPCELSVEYQHAVADKASLSLVGSQTAYGEGSGIVSVINDKWTSSHQSNTSVSVENATTGKAVQLLVGSSGHSRGLFDTSKNEFIIFRSVDDKTVINGPNFSVAASGNVTAGGTANLTNLVVSGWMKRVNLDWSSSNQKGAFIWSENTVTGQSLAFGIAANGYHRGLYDGSESRWIVVKYQSGQVLYNGLYSNFDAVSVVILSGTTIAAGGLQSGTTDISKSGWYPIAIAGWTANTRYATPVRYYLSARGNGTGTISWFIHNTSSNAQAITASAYVLWARGD